MLQFTEQEKQGVYKAIEGRRDIRSFLKTPVPEDAIQRILEAGHHAPSVGFMQPWNFIMVTEQEIKDKLAYAADKERRALAIHYEGTDRSDRFMGIKVQGLQEAPLTICITNDPTRGGAHVLGRNSIPETDVLSVACAIQNMWLASCAEGIALGWVSFYKKADVREILGIPPHIEPVALLSLGYTNEYPDRPLLEVLQWEKRRNLQELIFQNEWGVQK
ncbi:5,6-dimethylbenzimidazole synthase [Brevibacillus laterosporus]|uniref:5,6-dimethylbenzimidazole synthase n=1 Tax=Brevibacillus laterosporus TaxID=1465 RepID=UPI0018CE0BA8|nr:5,6-dimethylbenzimidazole synthase [Brevibacillus laterosporus]MBG9789849.1 cob(II)yrinic acid a,c-diamide reductase [Brevibacillus laterosporus]